MPPPFSAASRAARTSGFVRTAAKSEETAAVRVREGKHTLVCLARSVVTLCHACRLTHRRGSVAVILVVILQVANTLKNLDPTQPINTPGCARSPSPSPSPNARSVSVTACTGASGITSVSCCSTACVQSVGGSRRGVADDLCVECLRGLYVCVFQGYRLLHLTVRSVVLWSLFHSKRLFKSSQCTIFSPPTVVCIVSF